MFKILCLWEICIYIYGMLGSFIVANFLWNNGHSHGRNTHQTHGSSGDPQDEQKMVQPPNPVWFLPTKWILWQRFPPIFRGLSSSSSCLGTTKLNETWIASCVPGAAKQVLSEGERRRRGWKKKIRKMLKPSSRH